MAEIRPWYRWTLIAASVCGSLLAVRPADAAGPARLSADLADHLAAGSQAIDVIVHGDRATVNALAARYNLVVRRYLKSGAVIRVNTGQLAALQADGGDVAVSRPTELNAPEARLDQNRRDKEGCMSGPRPLIIVWGD